METEKKKRRQPDWTCVGVQKRVVKKSTRAIKILPKPNKRNWIKTNDKPRSFGAVEILCRNHTVHTFTYKYATKSIIKTPPTPPPAPHNSFSPIYFSFSFSIFKSVFFDEVLVVIYQTTFFVENIIAPHSPHFATTLTLCKYYKTTKDLSTFCHKFCARF